MRAGLRHLYSALVGLGAAMLATAALQLSHGDRSVFLVVFMAGVAGAEFLLGLSSALVALLGGIAGRVWYRQHHYLALPALAWESDLVVVAAGALVISGFELRRRNRERATRCNRELALVLENTSDAALIVSAEGKLATVNPAAAALLGPMVRELLGAPVTALRQHWRFVDNFGSDGHLEQACAAGMDWREEGAIFDVAPAAAPSPAEPGGRRAYVRVSLTPLRDARGVHRGMVLLLTDITPLKELQLHLLDNSRHLAVAQMTAGLTHDFNHVLDIVRRAVAVLVMKRDASAAERRKYHEMIDRAAADGAVIVRRLREYLAGGTGERAALDLGALAHEAVELTRPLWRSQARIDMVKLLAPVPLVQGNAADLRRVLVNLLFNAIDALGPRGGRVEVRTSVEPHSVCCTIEDEGAGISPAAQARLFQPYFTTKAKGLGMGLFGAQQIVLSHGGNLTFFSEPGRGTRFDLELPISAPVQEKAA